MENMKNPVIPKKKKKTKKIFRKILLTLLLLVILAGAAWYGYNSLKAEYTVTYQANTATTGTISNSLSFSGTLQTVNSESHSAKSDATVRTVYVSAGDKVSKGEKLLRLSTGQTLTAGIDGTVNQLPVAVGDEITSGTLLCDVVDFDHMQVSIRVDEYDINHVKPGDACRVTTTATEQTFESSIRSINYVSSSSGSVAYYTALAYVDVAPGTWPGMQVTVTVPREEATDVVILKMDAISFDEKNKAFVYVPDAEGTMTPSYITTGVSNGSYVEITSGLKAGDTVYKEVQVSSPNGIAAMFSSMFGSQRVLPGGNNRNTNRNWNNDGTNTNNRNNNTNNNGNQPFPGGNR